MKNNAQNKNLKNNVLSIIDKLKLTPKEVDDMIKKVNLPFTNINKPKK